MMVSGERKVYFTAIIFTLILSACATTQPKKGSERPPWIDTPPSSGLTASASASYEIFGEAKARENAVLKALSTIALQKSNRVDVNGQVDHISQYTSNGSTESLSENASISIKTRINGREIPVNAKITAYWKDKTKKRIWVLMEEN